MADLASGRYKEADPWWIAVGSPVNASNPSVPAFVNASSMASFADGAAALATGVATGVAVAVDQGAVISKISVLVGGTAEATGTHAWAALYSGQATPALLAQSADNTSATAVGPASGRFDFTLQTPQLITATNAPFGYVYASIMVAATTVPSLVSMGALAAAATNFQWWPNAPVRMGAFGFGTALTTTAPATITVASTGSVSPLFWLT